ncbi:MAG: metallophosphoesterase [Cyanobacteria bacterium J06642_2]
MRRKGRVWIAVALLATVGIGVGAIAGLQAARQSPLPARPPAKSDRTVTSNPKPATTPLQVNTPKVLPPETAQIVSSAGPNGLFQPTRGDVRLAVISDLNGPYGSTDYEPEVDKAIALLPFWQPDLAIAGGDMIAGQKLTLTDEQLQAMWASFDEHVAAPLRQMQIPFGFTIGNHDGSGAGGASGFVFQRERDAAAAYWQDADRDPGLNFGDRADFPFYYSFMHDEIFFLVWDGSTAIIPPDKLAWVEETLASPVAQNAKLRILVGHLPLYAVAQGRNAPGEVMTEADRLRAMLERYDVHTYISGHHHAYYPGQRGQLQLLHAGLIGSGPRPLIDSNAPPRKSLTVVDIDLDAAVTTRYTTYDMRSLELIEYAQLPRFLVGHNGIVLRRDVDGADLTVAERSLCTQRLSETLCTP